MRGTLPALKNWLLAVRWGGHALISLYISALSGVALGLQYNPAEPFYSTATIHLVIPFGAFWRSLHYYSSQAFFLLLLVHFAAVIWENSVRFTSSAWLRLSAAAPVGLSLLFTGYILRGDATGEAAGAIAENIALSIPLFGPPLNKLLVDVGAAGAQKIYLHHVAGLMLLGAFCLWPHLRRYSALWRNHLPTVMLLLAAAAAIKTPFEPGRFGLLHIAGPWFFWGMQELLRYLPAFWAGIAVPAMLAVPLLFLPAEGRARRGCLLLAATWLLGYAVLSGLAFARL
ncbi:cytochrome b N-terminal domain-containing protein [Candidatus Electronema sp. TJ]|uniref:cytochrome b N-terminal domain-containing protein n=1 Tax=Candidatus Electronema sp. TJ TaxID=3401573 RepID=UPI003AA9A47E